MLIYLSGSTQELLTPEEAIKRAVENNLSLKIRTAYVDIADNRYSYGEAGFMPRLDVYADHTGRVDDIELEFLNGETLERDNAQTYGLGSGLALSWMVFDGMNRFHAYNRLGKEKDMEQLNKRQQTEEIISQTIFHYYEIVRKKQTMLAIAKSVEVSRERMNLESERFELGVSSKMEYLQAKVDYHADSSAYMREEQLLEVSKIRLNRLMAVVVDEQYTYSDTIVHDALPAYQEMMDAISSQNTSVLLRNRDKELAELDLKLSRGDMMPKLSVGANYGFTQSRSEAGFVVQNRTLGLSYGVNLTFNLFDGFIKRRAIQNAEINTFIKELELEDQKEEIRAELRIAFESYVRERNIWLLERENLNAADENLEIARERFQVGSISGFEFREAQRTHLEARSRFIDAGFELKMAEIEVQKIGGLLVK